MKIPNKYDKAEHIIWHKKSSKFRFKNPKESEDL